MHTTLFDWADNQQAQTIHNFTPQLAELESLMRPVREAEQAFQNAYNTLDDVQEARGQGRQNLKLERELETKLQDAASKLRKAADKGRKDFRAFISKPGRDRMEAAGLLEADRKFLFEELAAYTNN